MLSSDVDAGFDPIYASVSDKTNAGLLGKGISLNKYTGARGKSGASDANAEYVAWIRNLLEKYDNRDFFGWQEMIRHFLSKKEDKKKLRKLWGKEAFDFLA